MKRLISLLSAMILLLAFSTALADDWYCPQCGTKCTENFCPKDGTKRPDDSGSGSSAKTAASDLKVDNVRLETDGSVTVSWSGGKSPYNVYYQYYINSNYNSGADDVILWCASSDTYDTRANYKYDFVPGEHYWVIVEDADKNAAWYDYDEYIGAFSRASCPFVFTLRTFRQNRSSMVRFFSARDIENEFSYHMFGANIRITPKLRDSISVVMRMGIKLPSGEPILIHVEDGTLGRTNGYYLWENFTFNYLWNTLMKNKKTIPTGTYQFKMFFDNEYVFTTEFLIEN